MVLLRDFRDFLFGAPATKSRSRRSGARSAVELLRVVGIRTTRARQAREDDGTVCRAVVHTGDRLAGDSCQFLPGEA
ncbi:hypothetical protein OHB14_58855 [Streptomyces sp. NBC_01613]|uniref:hypothetical protein n=1 Tax=Streptomyces sp. NBC_01613 TaxID=2975896 RepID=UPI00386D057D